MPIELIHISLGISFLLIWALIAEIVLRNRATQHPTPRYESNARRPLQSRKPAAKSLRSKASMH
jgi:hypothetical protein